MDILDPTTNLISSSACDINTKFVDRCHTDWSQNNLISIVSLDGIYILRPQLERTRGPFAFDLIKNPSQRFKHDLIKGSVAPFDELVHSLNPTQYAELFLDPALTTNINKLQLDSFPRRYRLTKWSPIVDVYPRQCLLATLTVDYQLVVFSRKCGIWLLLADLSSDHDLLRIQTDLNADFQQQRDTSFESIRLKLYSLSFCHFCWSGTDRNKKTLDDSSSILLLASTILGDIVIWNLVTTCNEIKFELKTILKTGQQHINSMQLYGNLLIATSRNGQVVLHDLTNYIRHIEYNTALQPEALNAQDSQPLFYVVSPTAILWHPDNIEVNDFYLQTLNANAFRIILSKSTNICWCTIHYTEQTNQELATLTISDSFSAIDGLDPEISLHQTSATWLRPAGDSKAILTADDGSFFQLDFIDDRQDTGPAFNAIRTVKTDLTDFVPRGLCVSPNGHLIIMISSITFLFDPIRISAPTKLIVLPTLNDKRFFTDCVQKLFDENWLAANNIRSPVEVCDRIDYLRSVFACLQSEQLHQLSVALNNHLDRIDFPRNKLQLVKFKIVAFLLMKLYEFSNSRMIDEDKFRIHFDRTQAHDRILLYYIEKILSRLFPNSNTVASDSLNSHQINSLRNMMFWLDQHETIADHLKDSYAGMVAKLIEEKYADVPYEKCPLCLSDMTFDSIEKGSCLSGHRYTRCSRSLLVLDINQSDEVDCEHCKRHYMTVLIWPPAGNEDLWLCPFCQ